HVDEVADALDRQAEVPEVVLRQAPRRIVALQVRERLLVEEQAQRQLLAGLRHQELLAGPALLAADGVVASVLADHEGVDIQAGLNAVQRLEPALHACEHRRRLRGCLRRPRLAHWSFDPPRWGRTPTAASLRAAQLLRVCS